jgi:hypothetical protein
MKMANRSPYLPITVDSYLSANTNPVWWRKVEDKQDNAFYSLSG